MSTPDEGPEPKISCYVTTSRKARQATRRLARSLSKIFNCAYGSRGKRSFNSVLSSAEGYGISRVIFIYERHGNPREIYAVDVCDGQWVENALIEINSVLIGRVLNKIAGSELYVSGELAEKISSVFNCQPSGSFRKAKAVLASSGNTLTAAVGGEDKIVLKVLSEIYA